MIILTIPLGCVLSWLLLNEPLIHLWLLGGLLVVLAGALIPRLEGSVQEGLLV